MIDLWIDDGIGLNWTSKLKSSVLGIKLKLYDVLGLYSQVTKCTWWMPWQSEAMKDV